MARSDCVRFAASAIHVTSYSSPTDTLTDDGHLAPSYPIIGYDSAMVKKRNGGHTLGGIVFRPNVSASTGLLVICRV
ncbi:LPS-assembly protein LptD [Trichinella spiralis]|uniref:LPS-assembly protein LptD n=1 Tax=Trichinella spiralis TaxID=6334 RepID=A0ABR3KST2_TRISP